MYTLALFCCLVAAANAGFLNYGHYGYYGGPVAYAAPVAVYAKPYIGSSQYRAQDTLGQYNYGYASTDGISKSEARGVDGSVAGGYAYTGPEGKQVHISYTAGADGFKASGDAIPKSVEPTPEVVAATNAHLAAKTEAAIKAAEAPKVVAVAGPVGYGYHPGYYGYHGHHLGGYYAYGAPHVAYKHIVHEYPKYAHFGYGYTA